MLHTMTMEYGTITGRLVAAVADTPDDPDVNPDIIPITGTVTFTPSVKAILVASEAITVVPAPITAVLDANGYVSLNGVQSVTVLATTSTYYNPNGWTYKVSFDNLAANGRRVTFDSYNIEVPVGATIDLSSVTPISSSTGTPIVRGPKGDKGDQGPQGNPGPSDAQVATYFTGPSSTRTAADARYLPGTGFLNARAYGAKGDGVTDDTAALQAAITAAQAAGGTLAIPSGTYKISSSLTTSQSFVQPNIVGAGAKSTILAATGAFSILKLVGGSGQLAVSTIANLSLTGSTAVGIELSGIGGVTVSKCRFTSIAAGVLFNNFASGSFTEFDVVEKCVFESDCILPIEYRRGSGNESFHGSGFNDCVFVQPTSGGGPTIKVGSGCLVYGAPWDGTFFVNSTQPIIRNDNVRRSMTYGNLRFEGGSNGGTPIIDPASAADYIVHQGDVYGFSNGVSVSTKFVLAERTQINPNGSISLFQKKQSIQKNATTGTTALTGVLSGHSIVSLQLIGANYTYNYLLFVYQSPFNPNGSVTILANGESFNSAGWGAPTFSVSNYMLQMTNSATGFSVAATVGIDHVAGSSAFY